jgi:hypothetical protein
MNWVLEEVPGRRKSERKKKELGKYHGREEEFPDEPRATENDGILITRGTANV